MSCLVNSERIRSLLHRVHQVVLIASYRDFACPTQINAKEPQSAAAGDTTTFLQEDSAKLLCAS